MSVLGECGDLLPQQPLERGRGSPTPLLMGLGDSICAGAWWMLQDTVFPGDGAEDLVSQCETQEESGSSARKRPCYP